MSENTSNNSENVVQMESELIKRAKKGCVKSFETLILSCKEKAFNIALRYMKNEEDALDALQESFIKIYRHLSKFNEQSRFDTWVYRIVVNSCNDMLRKNSKLKYSENIYRSEDENDVEIEIADSAPGPEKELERKEDSKYIIDCLNKLNDEHREIVVLRDINGFSYEEISEILDCSIGTVKSKISRARQKFKEVYLEYS
jgi:RNA polymerase sigma-70 factor (ECF subfamily)